MSAPQDRTMPMSELADIDESHQLEARYFRLMDQNRWEDTP
jgi:hypothetical protein